MSTRTRRSTGLGGFTLVELIVAIVISAILLTVVVQLIVGQARFVAIQSAREEVQQNARGALEIVASELRSVPPYALISANDQALSFQLPRVWGIMCGREPTAGVNTVDVVLPDVPSAPNLYAFDQLQGVRLEDPASAQGWWPAAGTNVGIQASANVAGASPCNAMAPAGARVLRLTLTAAPVNPPVQGLRLYTYQTVVYNLGTSDGFTWLRRGQGAVAPQPLAGPVEPDEFAFRYLTSPGTVVAAPVGNRADLDALRLIEIEIEMRSSSDPSGRTQRNRDATTIELRNNT